MIPIIIYFTVMIVLLVIAYKKEIYWMYCIIRGKKMRHLFPEYYKWKEEDKILYHQNYNNDEFGKLQAMSEDGIIVSTSMGSRELKPFQIIENTSRKKRLKKKKYKEFHEDILPVISSGKSNFKQPKMLQE